MFTRGYFKTLYAPLRESAGTILEEYIQKLDKDSEFEIKTRPIRHLPPKKQIELLVSGKFGDYDALICFKGIDPAGFFAFERKPDEKTIHVFRLQTEEKHKRQGIAIGTLVQLVMDTFSNGYTKLRVGKGTDEEVTRVLNSFKRQYAGPMQVEVRPETGEIFKQG